LGVGGDDDGVEEVDDAVVVEVARGPGGLEGLPVLGDGVEVLLADEVVEVGVADEGGGDEKGVGVGGDAADGGEVEDGVVVEGEGGEVGAGGGLVGGDGGGGDAEAQPVAAVHALGEGGLEELEFGGFVGGAGGLEDERSIGEVHRGSEGTEGVCGDAQRFDFTGRRSGPVGMNDQCAGREHKRPNI